MATIIAMAYLSGRPTSTSARTRPATSRRSGGSPHSLLVHEREPACVRRGQMLYGVHVFARAKVIPDLALSRGAEAYERARAIGDRQLEFLAAGGTALSYLELGDLDEAASGSIGPRPWRGEPDAARGRGSSSYGADSCTPRAAMPTGCVSISSARCRWPPTGPARGPLRGARGARAGGGDPRQRAGGRGAAGAGRTGGSEAQRNCSGCCRGTLHGARRPTRRSRPSPSPGGSPSAPSRRARSAVGGAHSRATRGPGPRGAAARRRSDHGGRHRRGTGRASSRTCGSRRR